MLHRDRASHFCESTLLYINRFALILQGREQRESTLFELGIELSDDCAKIVVNRGFSFLTLSCKQYNQL